MSGRQEPGPSSWPRSPRTRRASRSTWRGPGSRRRAQQPWCARLLGSWLARWERVGKGWEGQWGGGGKEADALGRAGSWRRDRARAEGWNQADLSFVGVRHRDVLSRWTACSLARRVPAASSVPRSPCCQPRAWRRPSSFPVEAPCPSATSTLQRGSNSRSIACLTSVSAAASSGLGSPWTGAAGWASVGVSVVVAGAGAGACPGAGAGGLASIGVASGASVVVAVAAGCCCCCCCCCLFFLLRLKMPLKAFLTWASASGAARRWLAGLLILVVQVHGRERDGVFAGP